VGSSYIKGCGCERESRRLWEIRRNVDWMWIDICMTDDHLPLTTSSIGEPTGKVDIGVANGRNLCGVLDVV
jgi:hypothetical protein